MRWLVVLVVAAACSRDIRVLEREANAIAAANQPKLDALVARVHALQRDLRGNRTDWETMLRSSEVANDTLGLPPFTQTTPPGSDWRPSPATLLGIAGYVRGRAGVLAAEGKRHELEVLVADERRRYTQGIADVDSELAQVERWLTRP